MPQVNVRLSDHELAELDRLVETHRFKDRSTAIRAALRQASFTEDQRAKGRRIIALDEKAIRDLNIAIEIP